MSSQNKQSVTDETTPRTSNDDVLAHVTGPTVHLNDMPDPKHLQPQST